MAFWMREASLKVGKKKFSLDKFDFEFEVPFEDSDEVPTATIKIKNLSKATRSGIKKGQTCILNAGYEGNVGSILIGKVVGLKNEQSQTDWVTTITVQPNGDKVLSKSVNKTYKRGSKASAIVRDMLNMFGVEISKCELAKDKTYPKGKVCKGKLKQQLDAIVKDCGSKMVIRPTGQVLIYKPTGGIMSGLELSAKSGLLLADSETVVFEPPKKEDKAAKSAKSKSKSKTKEKPDTIKRVCVLNYKVATAEIVRITSASLNGRFKVWGGKHKGSRTGSWETSMELVPYNGPIGAKKSTAKKAAASSTSSSPSKAVGSTVNFTGTKHYVSSNSASPRSCKPGQAKVFAIAKGAKHPYSLVATSGSKSTVYGWVDASDVS